VLVQIKKLNTNTIISAKINAAKCTIAEEQRHAEGSVIVFTMRSVSEYNNTKAEERRINDEQ
jgi:hypothetical protein